MKREIIYVHIIKRRGKTWFRSKRPKRVRGSGGGGGGRWEKDNKMGAIQRWLGHFYRWNRNK